MALYTIIAEYEGGTYLSQVEARDEREAALRWPDSDGLRDVASALQLPLEVFRDVLTAPEAAPVGDLRSCWCVTAPIEDQLLVLYIVETAARASP